MKKQDRFRQRLQNAQDFNPLSYVQSWLANHEGSNSKHNTNHPGDGEGIKVDDDYDDNKKQISFYNSIFYIYNSFFFEN